MAAGCLNAGLSQSGRQSYRMASCLTDATRLKGSSTIATCLLRSRRTTPWSRSCRTPSSAGWWRRPREWGLWFALAQHLQCVARVAAVCRYRSVRADVIVTRRASKPKEFGGGRGWAGATHMMGGVYSGKVFGWGERTCFVGKDCFCDGRSAFDIVTCCIIRVGDLQC